MSVKDVREYYLELEKQKADMEQNLKDFAELAEQNMFPPERLKQIKENFAPIIRNYELLSYVMYLLNRPNRKEKASKYDRQNKKVLQAIPKSATKTEVLAQNNHLLTTVKGTIKDLKGE